MEDLAIYSSKSLLFISLNWVLIICYIFLFIASMLRPVFSIVPTYKRQIKIIVFCIAGSATCNKYLVRILLFLSSSWKISSGPRWFICYLGDSFFLFITFVITDISISFYCFYKLTWSEKKKKTLQYALRVLYILVSLMFIFLAISNLHNIANDFANHRSRIYPFFIWSCVIASLFISTLLLLGVAKSAFSVQVVKKIKRNAMLVSGVFIVSIGIYFMSLIVFRKISSEYGR